MASRIYHRYCNPGTAHRWLPFGFSMAIGFITSGIIVVLDNYQFPKSFANRKKINLSFLQILTPIAALLGTIAMFYDASQDFGSLISCRSPLPLELSVHASVRWTAFFVHLYFTARIFINWVYLKHTEFLYIILYIALFTQELIGLVLQQEMLTFRFMILFSLRSREVKECLSKLVKINPSFISWKKFIEMLFIIIVLAFFLRAAEEWDTNYYLHRNYKGYPTLMKSCLSYVYWKVVAISTVGFGDIIPSTIPGQAVLILAMFFFLVWFMENARSLVNDSNYLIKLMTNDCSVEYKGQYHHLVVGIKDEQQLKEFLKYFPKKDHGKLVVVISHHDEELSVEKWNQRCKIIEGNNPLDVIKDYPNFMNNSKASIWLLYDLQSDDPADVDYAILTMVQKCKVAKIMARLFVRVMDVKTQAYVHQVHGWRGHDGTDVCIATDLLDAHLLVLSAHSRLIPALYIAAVDCRLEVEHSHNGYSIETMSSFALNEYDRRGRLLLGVVDKGYKIFLPHKVKFTTSKVFLVPSSSNNKTSEVRERNGKWPIQTTAICHTISVVGKGKDLVENVLLQHPFPEHMTPTPEEFVIFSGGIQKRTHCTHELLTMKDSQDCISHISTLEHTYESCLHGYGCVCGTFENSSLAIALLSKAYNDPILYALCLEILEGNHLAAEKVNGDFLYRDLFKFLLVKYNRIALGVETLQQMNDGPSAHFLMFNPPPSFQVKDGDLVVFLQP